MSQTRHRKPDQIYPLEEANNRLQDIFRNHDFDLVSHSERHKLARFYQLLMENQKENNFTRLVRFHDIAIKHFIDSLMILKWITPKFPLLDIGTGPGFPGIPLKIKFPDEKILLAEGVQKRVAFLKRVRDDMEFHNLEIIGRQIDSQFMYPVSGVITRALESVGNTLMSVQNSLIPEGEVYLMKGPNVDSEIVEAQKNWGHLYELIKDIPYTLPKTTHQRRLLIYKKIVPLYPLINS